MRNCTVPPKPRPRLWRTRGSCSAHVGDSQDGVGLVKILSIRQPWAYLITRSSKDIENRSWPTKYRGPFLIHASLRVDNKACLDHGLDPSKLQTGGARDRHCCISVGCLYLPAARVRMAAIN